jgi:L-cysteine:1D-myo-inositol 2-amino-2-deoxy-alpha-D-glucopyranoside ligase
MEALGIIPPNHYVAVTERVGQVADAVQVLLARGMAYRLDIDAGAAVAPGLGGEARGGVTQIQVDSYPDVYRDANPDSYPDIYFDNSAAEAGSPWRLGDESHFDRATMLRLSAERGGDPDRPGKRDALDPLLWRAARPGEPSWDSPVGAGRPGWHIECSLIAQDYLEVPVTVNGGGSDLIFPHHEFSGGHTAALTGKPLAALYSHAGLVAYLGEKMSKSLGNLVFVSKLTEAGVDPRAIRLAILAQSYRANWEWTDAVLATASERLDRWVAWATRTQATTHANGNTDAKTSTGAKTNTDAKTISDAKTRTDAKSNTDADLVGAVVGDVVGVSPLLARLRLVLANDLDSPAALAEVDSQISAGANPIAGDLEAIDALLGIRLLR